MEDEDDDISDIIKDCTIDLRKRMSPEDTVPFMYARHHFTDSERDKVSCISSNKGREPANDEILSIVATKPKSFITLAASLKVNRNDQLFEKVFDIVRKKNSSLSEQIECEVRRLDPGLPVDQVPKDHAADEKSGSRLDSSVEVQQSIETNIPQSSQEMLVADTMLQANPTADLNSEQDDRIGLDDYNSDLHLCIDSDGYGAEPLTDPPGFSYLWAGVKATYGVLRGKVFYEVKLVKELPIESESERSDPDQYVFRVGWSLNNSSLQLGEEPDSYGFGSTGKASCSNYFMDYGETYGIDDVIGVFLDLESRPPCIFYTKNGCSMGVAKRLGGLQVGKRDQALFPHILTKNIRFEVNFGQESPWFVPVSGFLSLIQCSVTDKIRGLKPPNKQSLCEIIMIIGLPGSGKTTWAIKKAKDNPKKRYNILGTDLLVDKMKVWGLQRKFNFKERWDMLIPKASKCFEKLLEIACKKKRNYTLDQTNVYASARKSKMSKFSGFIRRAAVIVPDNVELTRRSEKRTLETGKSVPEESILKMKRNFILPWKKDDNFDSIEYADLPEDKAALLVTSYNMEGKLAQGEKSSEQCGGKEGSQIQQTQPSLGFKQAFTIKESSETAEKSVAQTTQMIRSVSTPSADEKTARQQLTRSHSASPVVHYCSSQIRSTSDTFGAIMSAAQKNPVIRSLSTPPGAEKTAHEQITRGSSAHPVAHNCSSHIVNTTDTSDTFKDLELDDVDDKIITRLGEKLSNSSEHDKPMWELVLPHLELTVTMREKKSIRKSRETGVEFLEFLGDRKVTVNQLVEAFKAAGLPEFCKILPQDKLHAEINTAEMMYQETTGRTCDFMKQSESLSPNNRTEIRSITSSENEEEKSTIKEDDISVTVPKAVSPENTACADTSLLQDISEASSYSSLTDSKRGVSCINTCESQCPAELPKTDLQSSFSETRSLPEQREVIAATDDLLKLQTGDNVATNFIPSNFEIWDT